MMATLITRAGIDKPEGNRWCRLEIELSDDGGRLSICGSEGRILKTAAAKREALAYWESFFDESPAELDAMNKKCGKRFTSSKSAARFVIESDGDLHGLDVSREDERGAFITESCGQIRETLAERFPEAEPFFQWHLNDMHAGWEHQRKNWALEEKLEIVSYKLTTEAHQMRKEALAACAKAGLAGEAVDLTPTARALAELEDWFMPRFAVDADSPLSGCFEVEKRETKSAGWVRPSEHPRGLLAKPCEVCGYKYGTEWKRVELPPEVIAWAKGEKPAA